MKFPACITGALLSGAFAAAQENPVRLNQSGFYTAGPKHAVVMSPVTSGRFFITTPNGSDTVFSGELQPEKISRYSASRTRMADFSDLDKKGRFVLRVPGMAASYPFEVGDAPYRDLAVAVLKGFYFQRASMPLEAQYAGKWARPAGHPDTRVLVHPSAADSKRPAGTVIASPGGWYDAGDYNKYIVNSGITMYMLLSAYESFPAYFDQLNVNIPESGNGVPDILDESLYNLRWMMTMQDPNDGGVYHKCTNAEFDKMVMPHCATTQPRYVVQKSTAATCDFAAVMAIAYRVYGKFEQAFPGLADSCRNAAEQAWKWAADERNANLSYSQAAINKAVSPRIRTGEYGDRFVEDELSWAATEMLLAWGGSGARFPIARVNYGMQLPSWWSVRMLGDWSLFRFAGENGRKDEMQASIVHFADELTGRAAQNAFGTVMGQTAGDFNWGGNANAATQGIALVYAYLATKDRKYLDYALSNLDYLLGRNATGYCFVTGFGEKRPMHPHHRPSVADGIADPVPGFLVGGPNSKMEDGARYPFREVETAYVDSESAYACNEITINWNAPLVFLVNALEALKVEAGYVKE
ncbi:glycoside hydrolase family 9 protein [Chitinophaga rhizosphaerae]|uniref:glycoside hydrolase family 9 protein n=1 Tax=Chitinophaga rhizosphaerae TaxID=1864947 RepID=UPI000F806048|nr:glycoside hydrolase family 9 protein [Chitinophaga rhizosphaerae]